MSNLWTGRTESLAVQYVALGMVEHSTMDGQGRHGGGMEERFAVASAGRYLWLALFVGFDLRRRGT